MGTTCCSHGSLPARSLEIDSELTMNKTKELDALGTEYGETMGLKCKQTHFYFKCML